MIDIVSDKNTNITINKFHRIGKFNNNYITYPTNNCMHKFRFNILMYPYNTLNTVQCIQ